VFSEKQIIALERQALAWSKIENQMADLREGFEARSFPRDRAFN
jgi:hypothetical protein